MGDVTEWAKHFRTYAVDVIGQPGFSAPSRPAYESDDYAAWPILEFLRRVHAG